MQTAVPPAPVEEPYCAVDALAYEQWCTVVLRYINRVRMVLGGLYVTAGRKGPNHKASGMAGNNGMDVAFFLELTLMEYQKPPGDLSKETTSMCVS